MAEPPSFPRAQKTQIIRANQRDIYHVSSLREQTENVLRSWYGTRWLTRWEKEVDLVTKLIYYGITVGRGNQSLGEEYTEIRQHVSLSNRILPSGRIRGALVLLSTFPSYILVRLATSSALNTRRPEVVEFMKILPSAINVAAEINLAIFYLKGTYYDSLKRLLGVQYLSSTPEDPHVRLPSYSLLGVLLGIRLIYRLVSYVWLRLGVPNTSGKDRQPFELGEITSELFIDEMPVSRLLDQDPSNDPARLAEEDERTILDVTAIPEASRAGRNCTLCLEERTDSCSTDCGHLFCWNCIVGWGREKAECPLCRQSLNLARLLPIYNL